MALVRFSNLVNDIRGATGGNQFSRCTAGAMVSARHHKRRMPKKANAANTLSFTAIAKAWRDISPAAHNSWLQAVSQVSRVNRLGLSRTPTGFELFQYFNSLRMQAFHPLLDSYTPYFGNVKITASQPTLAPGTLVLSLPVIFSSPLIGRIITYVSRPVPPGQSIPGVKKFKVANRFAFSSTGTFLVSSSTVEAIWPQAYSYSGATIYFRFLFVPADFTKVFSLGVFGVLVP